MTASVAVPCSCKQPITVHMGLMVTQQSPLMTYKCALPLHPTGSKVHPQAPDSTSGFRLNPRLQTHPQAPDSTPGSRLIPRLQTPPQAPDSTPSSRLIPRLQTPPQAPPAGPRLNLQAPGLTRLQHLPYCAMQGHGH